MNLNKLERFLSLHTKTLLVITCGLLFTYILCRKPRTIYQNTKDPAELKVLQQYKDANGKLYTKLQQQEVEKAAYKQRLDSFAKLLKIKPKQIKGEEVVTVVLDTQFVTLPSKVVVVAKDTLYRIEKHDPWVDVVAIAGRVSGTITLKVKDTFTRLETVKTSWFKPTVRTVYILNKNPYSRASTGSSFTFKEKQIWLTIGPYIGYDPFSRSLSGGISAQVPIIKLKR
jgi:hypothetical protein